MRIDAKKLSPISLSSEKISENPIFEAEKLNGQIATQKEYYEDQISKQKEEYLESLAVKNEEIQTMKAHHALEMKEMAKNITEKECNKVHQDTKKCNIYYFLIARRFVVLISLKRSVQAVLGKFIKFPSHPSMH